MKDDLFLQSFRLGDSILVCLSFELNFVSALFCTVSVTSGFRFRTGVLHLV